LVFLLLETIIFATQFQTMRKVSIGVVQMSCVADKEANLQKAIAGIEKAAAQGAQIVCLQELFTSLYFCDVESYDNFLLAESIEILFYPTAIGWATSQDPATNTEQYGAWQTIQRSHAVANGVHVVSVNRVGLEQNGAMQFWGGSFVSNPFGTIIWQATHEQEEIKVLEIDLSKTDHYRTHWPFLRDRRIDSYDPITKRYVDEH